MRRLLALLVFLVAAGPLPAAEVKGVKLADEMELAGQALVLNGAGVRSKFFVKVYVGALYLPKASADPQAILAMPGPKRILLHFLYDKVERDKLVGAWNDGFAGNLDEDQRRALEPAIASFNGLFGDARRGEEIWIDLLPGGETRVTQAGETAGSVQDEALQRAVLGIFIGEQPADGSLKAGMLGR